jgi:hypothetical protein
MRAPMPRLRPRGESPPRLQPASGYTVSGNDVGRLVVTNSRRSTEGDHDTWEVDVSSRDGLPASFTPRSRSPLPIRDVIGGGRLGTDWERRSGGGRIDSGRMMDPPREVGVNPIDAIFPIILISAGILFMLLVVLALFRVAFPKR